MGRFHKLKVLCELYALEASSRMKTKGWKAKAGVRVGGMKPKQDDTCCYLIICLCVQQYETKVQSLRD